MAKIHKMARKLENDVAADLGGRRIFLSGAGSEKADIRVKKQYTVDRLPTDALAFRIEAKSTSNAKYTLKAQDWRDVAKSADAVGEEPLIVFGFESRACMFLRWVVLRAKLADELQIKRPEGAYTLMSSLSMRVAELATNMAVTCYLRPLGAVEEILCITPYPMFLEALEKHAAR